LNINLPGQLKNNAHLLNLNEPGQISDEQSILFQSKLKIITRDAPIWWSLLSTQPELSTILLDDNKLLLKVRNNLSKPHPLFDSVSKIIAQPEGTNCTQSENDLVEYLCKFVIAFQQKDFLSFEKAVNYFVGRGSGLTPSGDDLLMGIIYSLFYFQEYIPFSFDQITHSVTGATNKTTRISASLIACAAQGELDERLLFAYQSLMTNQEPSAEIVSGLLNWGSSSGLDALAGMLLGCHILSLKLK
jgi:hypothetical protein